MAIQLQMATAVSVFPQANILLYRLNYPSFSNDTNLVTDNNYTCKNWVIFEYLLISITL